MPGLQAERLLIEQGTFGLKDEQVYDLYLAATGDEDQAREGLLNHLEAKAELERKDASA